MFSWSCSPNQSEIWSPPGNSWIRRVLAFDFIPLCVRIKTEHWQTVGTQCFSHLGDGTVSYFNPSPSVAFTFVTVLDFYRRVRSAFSFELLSWAHHCRPIILLIVLIRLEAHYESIVWQNLTKVAKFDKSGRDANTKLWCDDQITQILLWWNSGAHNLSGKRSDHQVQCLCTLWFGLITQSKRLYGCWSLDWICTRVRISPETNQF